jgi:cytochrome c oxidase subunit 2
MAKHVDYLYFFLVAVSLFFSVLIFTTVFFFAVRYRRRSEHEIPRPIEGSLVLELAWSGLPLLLTMVMFAWGAVLYFRMYSPPERAIQVNVVGKQWMWKIQHPNGKREINELHMPVGQPVKLNMISEDVIHSFYVPAFRVKQDVLPGRYTHMWFEATKTGRYHLFCTEYCGTKHSGMIGSVVVMEPAEFEQWLAGTPVNETMEQAGERLFVQHNCNTCHNPTSGARGPLLDGLFGTKIRLATGETVTMDEAYIRESILNPQAKVVAGYRPVMPTFQGQISEEGILQLIAYIKSLTRQPAGPAQGQPGSGK